MTTTLSIRWAPDGFGRYHFGSSHPVWTSDPSLKALETIARNCCNIPPNEQCKISFLTEGLLDRVYSVKTKEDTYLIRVTLPIQPRLKTLSEVATIKFVRTYATDLVPDVLKYEATVKHTPENGGLGFEWMMMKNIPGDVVKNVWKQMDWEAKKLLVGKLAEVFAKLYEHPQSGIGNIYSHQSSSDSFTVGPIVSREFYWDYVKHSVSRGPYKSSYDWLKALIFFTLDATVAILTKKNHKDKQGHLNNAVAIHAQGRGENRWEDGRGDEGGNEEDQSADDEDDSDDYEHAFETQLLAKRIMELLPRIFPPPNDGSPEKTIIYHDQLSFDNLSADKSGQLTGITNWECVSALPLWYACSTLPSFLLGPTYAEKPDINTYHIHENGEPDSLYWINLLKWEQMELRAEFLTQMEKLQPEWVRTYRASILKYDLYMAIQQCSEELGQWQVARWLDSVERMTDEELRGDVGEEYHSLWDDFM